MDQELEDYDRILDDPDIDDERKMMKVITFLNTTKYALYDGEFRDSISEQVNGLLQKYQSGVLHDILTELSQKLIAINQEVKQHIPKNIQKIGKGTYGCVVQPALPNKSENGWISHENNVSKLYFDEEFGKKAIRNAKALFDDLKNDGHKMTRQMMFKGSNFPVEMQYDCEVNPNKTLFAARAPYLGIPIEKIGDHYYEFRKIPVETILGQILKLLSQLNKIQAKGYVHGDIREGNVMANPKTGQLTLIDFDWYMPKRKFFKDYFQSLGFYSNPPESLLNMNIMRHIHGMSLVANESPTQLSNYVMSGNKFAFRQVMNKYLLEKDVHAANVENIKQFRDITDFEEYSDAMFPTFDSYGLGYTLLELCAFVYPPGAPLRDRLTLHGQKYSDEEVAVVENTVAKLYSDVLLPMIELKMSSRISANEAFVRMNRLYEEYRVEMRSLVSNNLEMSARRAAMLDSLRGRGAVAATSAPAASLEGGTRKRRGGGTRKGRKVKKRYSRTRGSQNSRNN
jgi:serine/threonine protein kinase